MIPHDAAVVMVVRPTREFTKEELAVLRDYLRRDRASGEGEASRQGGGGDGHRRPGHAAGEPLIVKQGDTLEVSPPASTRCWGSTASSSG